MYEDEDDSASDSERWEFVKSMSSPKRPSKGQMARAKASSKVAEDRVPLLTTPDIDSAAGGDDAPKDTGGRAYAIFYLLGVGCLVPWNAFIMLDGYFREKLAESQYKESVLPYFTTGFQIVNILFLVFASTSPTINKIPVQYRIGIPLVIQFLAFVVILMMVRMDSVKNDEFFYYTFLLVLVSAGSTSFFQGGLFGLAGMMPHDFTQALMGGQGLGGFIVALLNIFTNFFLKDPIKAAFVFFCVSVAVLAACIISFFYLESLPIVHHYTVVKQPRRASCSVQADIPAQHEGPPAKSATAVFKKLLPMAGPVFFIFVVSLSVFPALGVKVRSQYGDDDNYGANLFIPIYCFGGFALSDLLGRSLAPRVMWPGPEAPGMMKWPVLARLVFIPLLMMCDIHTGLGSEPDLDTFPKVFKTDAAPYIIMFLIGLTNGYFSTLCMMYGPGLVDEPEQERAGFMMLLSLVFGLLAGSTMSFAVLAVLCDCNSFLGAKVNTTDG